MMVRAHDIRIVCRNAYKIFIGKPPLKKTPLRRPRGRWDDNFKVVVKEVG